MNKTTKLAFSIILVFMQALCLYFSKTQMETNRHYQDMLAACEALKHLIDNHS